jgi:DNA-directed RNA polymerase specialized sigma24 family protein
MDDTRILGLLDSNGNLLPPRIERALVALVPRLRRQFPLLQDDSTLIDVVEEAGRRICAREERGGPIEKLHGYAWVTLRSVATSEMRRGPIRLIQNTLAPEASRDRIASVPAEDGSVAQIERDILLREVFETLSPEEKLVCGWKKAGFSSEEIARFRGRSVVAVDTLFSRAKQKVRTALGLARARATQASRKPAGGAPAGHALDEADTERRDGRTCTAADKRRTAGGR